MCNNVKRIFVEKKQGFNVEAQSLFNDLRDNLGIKELKEVRIINRYDIEGINEDQYNKSREIIFSEKTVDNVYDETLEVKCDEKIFAVEYLPGQYDQRADSACQAIQILTQNNEKSIINAAKVIVLLGDISKEQLETVKKYCINPVDSREASLEKPASLDTKLDIPESVRVLKGFINNSYEELENFMKSEGLAMSFEDLKFCMEYFRDKEKRDPSITEIKVIDTYWSDHCRHTTFMTELDKVSIEEGIFAQPIKAAYEGYKASREYVYGDKHKEMCLMDIAVIGMKELRKRGLLNDLDVSEEINACSIEAEVDVDGTKEKWLIMFKNETHNHPTEIEPFGGAATCLGGAIRDPLSGRSYVYQAMRVTGSGDPRKKIEDTLQGKLPQRKITLGAAHGYSSYGNQIGLATGQVAEIYDDGFVAKRMEIGAVIAAAPKDNVIRKVPTPGDIVILLGGRTGRDGLGGATGSSKEHTEESILTCGAEVQKGNAPTERKIQRLFRNPKVSTLIKRCNDFGAGGVSVAIGELSDGLNINLDLVPKKYEGLDGTELAISESQERMAVVIEKQNKDLFIKLCEEENLEAVQVAEVTGDNRLKMLWKGNYIVDVNRDFLNTNGVRQKTEVEVKAPKETEDFFKSIAKAGANIKEKWIDTLRDLNVCSQKGLVERFDSTIGASTVLMPFGGKYQTTPAEGMAAKVPVESGETNTGTLMTYGYNPNIAKWSPFHGAVYAVVEAVTKIVAMGGEYSSVRLTLQEYFERLGKEASRWGKPFAALLGALHVQKELGIPAIGGKDSMSGTFKDMDVPPTLVAFAVNVADMNNIISPEFKKSGSNLVLVSAVRDSNELPDFNVLKRNLSKVTDLIRNGKVLSASSVRNGGLCEAVSKMSFGNKMGAVLNNKLTKEALFAPNYGSIVLEIDKSLDLQELFGEIAFEVIGNIEDNGIININGEKISIDEAYEAWSTPLEKIFKTKADLKVTNIENVLFEDKKVKKSSITIAKPRIFMTVFPGTNCEYDSKKAFERAGGVVDTLVFKNLNSDTIKESIDEMVKRIKNAQIIMLPGGFSAGDEPDGSGKFIATVFRNEKVKEAVMELLKSRDGLMLGICNGFQALIKLGLVPYGEIRDIDANCPTLTYNKIGRHISCLTQTKVVSTLSPWFNKVKLGDTYTIPVSHGEGRFVGSEEEIHRLLKNGQVATQYVNFEGNPSYEIEFNPNGSMYAIEGITSPDGRVLGKMGHSERVGEGLLKNVPGEKDQKIFEAGVEYFSK